MNFCEIFKKTYYVEHCERLVLNILIMFLIVAPIKNEQ